MNFQWVLILIFVFSFLLFNYDLDDDDGDITETEESPEKAPREDRLGDIFSRAEDGYSGAEEYY